MSQIKAAYSIELKLCGHNKPVLSASAKMLVDAHVKFDRMKAYVNKRRVPGGYKKERLYGGAYVLTLSAFGNILRQIEWQ